MGSWKKTRGFPRPSAGTGGKAVRDYAALIRVLGAEASLGRNLARHFPTTLDYGRYVMIRPSGPVVFCPCTL
jgi:hypothetical protein